MIETAFFYLFSVTLLLSAILVITARNPVHSVLFLILCFFNAAGLFIMLGAEFVAMIMMIVYVGAVAVLFLFVVMMLDLNFAELRKGMRRHMPVGAAVGGTLMAEMIYLYMTWVQDVGSKDRVAQPIPDATAITNTHALGHVLYTHYVYIFQVSGLILLVAMIGAIMLTHRQRAGTRHQDISKQVARDPKDVIRIEKITTGAGVL